MREADLQRVDEIADSIHTLFERAEVFAEKFNLYGPGCLVLDVHGTVLGYGISHPWMLHSIPPLDAFLKCIPTGPECLYVHDVAILPEARGQFLTRALCAIYEELAKRSGITRMALVSVYGTAPLWAESGFAVVDDLSLNEKLVSYGPTARYMIKTVA